MDPTVLSASVNESYSKQFRRGTVGSSLPKTQVYYPPSRPRSFSAGSQLVNTTPVSSTPAVKVVKVGNSKMHGKTKSLDDKNNCPASRYKTELCRPFQDLGYCKYSDKCQFAHGENELRVLPRHPKYKTELCRTYHTRGFCPYGSRCHFIHSLEEARKSGESSGQRSPTKKTLSFTLPISPSLDSGISSPDDVINYSNNRMFEFPSTDQGSSPEEYELDSNSLFYDHSQPLSYDSLPYRRDHVSSPDPYMEFDALSAGSGSPTKQVSENFNPDTDLTELFKGVNLDDNTTISSPRTPSNHRLPVFDDMLNSKSDTALLDQLSAGEESPRSFFLFPQ